MKARILENGCRGLRAFYHEPGRGPVSPNETRNNTPPEAKESSHENPQNSRPDPDGIRVASVRPENGDLACGRGQTALGTERRFGG